MEKLRKCFLDPKDNRTKRIFRRNIWIDLCGGMNLLIYEIPGRDNIQIENIVFDYNGTIAVDGKLVIGVKRVNK